MLQKEKTRSKQTNKIHSRLTKHPKTALAPVHRKPPLHLPDPKLRLSRARLLSEQGHEPSPDERGDLPGEGGHAVRCGDFVGDLVFA